MKTVDVAVGVILKNRKVFITYREKSLHQGDKWEFPGGKVEPNETVFEGLKRELKEEVGIDTIAASDLITVEHDYGDKKVRLHVLTVNEFVGTPHGSEGQSNQWVAIDKLRTLTFPEANKAIIDALLLQY